jgi:hypothetical protein
MARPGPVIPAACVRPILPPAGLAALILYLLYAFPFNARDWSPNMGLQPCAAPACRAASAVGGLRLRSHGKVRVARCRGHGLARCSAWPNRRLAAPSRAQSQTPRRPACISPRTGLDICHLQKGDILLETPSFAAKGIVPAIIGAVGAQVGTYWFHIGIYNGMGRVLEARGPNSAHPAKEVEATRIQYTGFYGTGKPSDAVDWVVLRIKPGHQAQIDRAVAWATERADNPLVGFMGHTVLQEVPPFLDPGVKAQDTRFYCSLYVWRAFERQGLDLDYHGAFPTSLATLFTPQIVRPDGLYASAVGPYAATTVVQDDHPGVQRALIILTHSALSTSFLAAWIYGPFAWLAAAVALCGTLRTLRRRRRRFPAPATLDQPWASRRPEWLESNSEAAGGLDVVP